MREDVRYVAEWDLDLVEVLFEAELLISLQRGREQWLISTLVYYIDQ